MKIALLGHGKTGSKVLELARDQHQVMLFDSKNSPTFEKLKDSDVIVSFLPGEVFLNFIPLLVETKIPVVCGSTGFSWPTDLDKTLREKNIPWIYGTNFSLGVVVIKQLLEKLHEMESLFETKTMAIHEVHHTKKLDAPSGTALSMNEWAGGKAEITSERIGDVIGLHTLSFETGRETILITHEARDRALFAEGALWAANFLVTNNPPKGLHRFQEIIETHLSRNTQ